MIEDTELLRRYTQEKSEAAFAELVRRHVDLVYAVAMRRLGGEAHLAEDVAQGVFTAMARKAGSLTRHPSVSAWLVRSARFAAAQAQRGENRRRSRETEAQLMHETSHPAAPEPNWSELRPVLDEVLDALPERDRLALWLRFYEGKAFAEIGRKLAASEDAARVRVDRALEKLRVTLARRGIVSTTAALTSALAREGAALAPAGLAASVTGAALAGAAAGGGIAVGLGLPTLMSTGKFGAWSAAAAVLCASLAGNAYLLTRPPREAPSPAPHRLVGARPATAPANTEPTLALVQSADLALLRDQLRATGANETSVRAMLEGILRRRYREQLSADRAERARLGWWRDSQRAFQRPGHPFWLADDQWLLRRMVTVPLEQLLGPDPIAVEEAEAKYAFLPAELRQAFGQLDRDTPPPHAATGNIDSDAAIEAEISRQRRASEEKREALLATLTPEQRAAWEMRTSAFATGLAKKLELVGTTEGEFLKVFPIADAYAQALAEKLPEGSDSIAARNELERSVMQQLVAALGYERALDYIWAGAREYPTYVRVAREANLPASTAGSVMQLAAETSRQAAAVHSDSALSLDQKRTALSTLQQRVRPDLDGLLPPAVQQRIPADALAWFTQLGAGGYKAVATTLPGRSGSLFLTSSLAIENPPSAAAGVLMRPIPQRPPAN